MPTCGKCRSEHPPRRSSQFAAAPGCSPSWRVTGNSSGTQSRSPRVAGQPDSPNPPRFDRKTFFVSRTVYYPGSGEDGQPVKLCALSHAAHTFIYVDHGVDRDTLDERLHDRKQGFCEYAIAHQEQVSEDVLRPGGWTPHVSAAETRNSTLYRDSFVEPFGWFVALRPTGRLAYTGGEDDGPRRLAGPVHRR